MCDTPPIHSPYVHTTNGTPELCPYLNNCDSPKYCHSESESNTSDKQPNSANKHSVHVDKTRHDSKMSAPPGPRGPPLIGQAFNIDTSHMHLQFMEWQKRYGDMFMFKILGKQYLVISHPDILREMFVTCAHANIFNDRPPGFMGKYVIGDTKDIVFRNMDDKQQRLKMETLNYLENTLSEEDWFYKGASEEFKDVVQRIELSKGTAVDIVSLLDSAAVGIIGLALLGKRIKFEDPEFRCLCDFMKIGNELGTVKNQTILSAVPCVRKFPGHLKVLYEGICEEKIRMRKYFVGENESNRGLVAHLKKMGTTIASDSKDGWLDENFIMGVVMDLTAAGIVPLQNVLSVLFLVLAHNIEIQKHLREECRRFRPRMSCEDSVETVCSVQDSAKMPYCTGCILELKRFHTPLSLSARHCNRTKDVKFESYNIPKNTEIFSNLFGIHHDERFWTEPWVFKPERFLTGDGNLVREDHPHMKNLIVNGVGPRRCVGSKMSDNVAFLATTIILEKFSIIPSQMDPLPSCDPRKFLPGVVSRAPDYKCVFIDAD